MTRYLLRIACLLLAVGCAHANEAGRIVYVVGQVNVANHGINQGDPVHEGDEITTGADGYVYLKTVDNGFLILRPSSRARIVNYHVDRNNPKNTRIKLELLNGVARSISGEAVKEARQNFRFNTPVAAIGVRGTDFTVFTDSETSRVAVISGGIVVAGFAGACGPEGSGPCEGNASRELFANQVGQMLQVRRGQAAPQLMAGSMAVVEAGAPRVDDNGGKGGTAPAGSNEVSLDAQKGANLQRQANAVDVPVTTTPPVIETRPVKEPETPVVPTIPVVPPKEITWGRWQAVMGKAPNADLSKMIKDGVQIDLNSYFVLYVAKQGASWTTPERGKVGFGLANSEAYIFDQGSKQVSSASLQNGSLEFNFDNKTFDTRFDLIAGAESFKMQAQGTVGSDGRFYGNSQFSAPTNMNVNGILGSAEAGDAYYLFQSSKIGGNRVVSGATYWKK